MKISFNGMIVDEHQAVLSVFDHGILYGIGLFETMRTFHGKPFMLEAHLQRLEEGCSLLQIPYAADYGSVRQEIADIMAANDLQEAYIRYTVTAGVEALGLPSGPYRRPTVIIYAKPLPESLEDYARNGRALQLLATTRNSPESGIRLKSLHYMNNIMAKRELERYRWADGAEGLMCDRAGYLAEGIVSNLFFIRDSCCKTPSSDTGLLPGITRRTVMSLCAGAGYAMEEGRYTWGELLQADEIFITNSVQGIVPVTRLFDPLGNRQEIAGGSPGKITGELAESYQRLTEAG